MRSAHKLVKETAEGMAAALYEECAKNDVWYAANPDQQEFVRRTYPELLEQARQILANMLKPESTTPEELKTQIADALIKDHQLVVGRGRATFGHTASPLKH